jgi:competence protein ComEA
VPASQAGGPVTKVRHRRDISVVTLDDMDELPLPSLSRRRLFAAAVVVAAGIVLLLRHHGGAGAGAVAPPVAPVQHASAPAVRQVVVDVVGAVRRPGLYRLREGSRIADAVALAGGATPRAQLAAVNLAAPIADGEQIVVPVRGAGAVAAGGVGGSSATPGASPTAPLDLNTATAEQLDALPGIGPSTAQKILDYRQAHGPFHSVDELDAVPGIGPGRIAQLKGLVIP